MPKSSTSELKDSLTSAAADVYRQFGGEYNEDVALWEVLQTRYDRHRATRPESFIIEPSEFIKTMINSAGLSEYIKWRQMVTYKVLVAVDPKE